MGVTYDFYTVVSDVDGTEMLIPCLWRGTRRGLGVYADVETFTGEARLAAAVGHSERRERTVEGGVRG